MALTNTPSNSNPYFCVACLIMYQKTKQDQLLVSLVKNNALRGWLLADEAAWQYVELSVLGVKLSLIPGDGIGLVFTLVPYPGSWMPWNVYFILFYFILLSKQMFCKL